MLQSYTARLDADGQDLSDAAGKLVAELRVISLPHDFANALHEAIQYQAALPFDRRRYDAHLDLLYHEYQSSGALYAATTVRAVGGRV